MNNDKVMYLYDEDFKTSYINGAFGAFSAKGDFVMNLFYEGIKSPDETTIEVLPDGNIAENFNLESKKITRKVEASVVMNIETAKSICQWLQENIDKFEAGK